MAEHSLHDIYSEIVPSYKQVFVVPLIRHDFPNSDYLYLLYKPFLVEGQKIKIKSISALGHWKFVWAQISGNKSILHYHWLEFQDFKSLIGMPYKLVCIWLYKLFGGKIVWTVHNLKPHDGKWLNIHQRIHTWMAGISDYILVHSRYIVNPVVNHYSVSKSKIKVHAHPKFPSTIVPKKDAIQTLNAKYQLQIDTKSKTFGFFGAITAYKKIVETVILLDKIDFKGRYLVFGYVKKGQQKLHRELLKLEKEFTWFEYNPGFVEEKDIPSIMSSFDWCLFYYQDVTTSGAFEMALSYSRNIIAPKKASFLDYEDEENVYLYSSEKELEVMIKDIA